MRNINSKTSYDNSPHTKKLHYQASDYHRQTCIKMKQYKYTEAPGKKTKDNMIMISKNDSIKINNNDSIPIRTLVQKLSSSPQLADLNDNQKIRMIMSQIQFHTKKQSQVDMSYKKFIAPRDTTYIPKPFVFDRYNYQNYQNYTYKNPYKPAKYPNEDKIIKQPSKTIKNGTSKNLQIVFCQQKYQQFVQKTNKQVSEYYQVSKKQSISNLRASSFHKLQTHRSRGSKSTNLKKSQSLPTGNMPYRPHNTNKKSTLSSYLQQFNTLQKLSQYMQRQQKLNEKFLFTTTNSDKSNTVLVSIIIHRFQFLKKAKKRCQQLIFTILLNLDVLPPYYKINIQDYLKFIQLFVSRDADQFALAMFVFTFLFKQEQQISIQAAKRSLNLLGGPANLHIQVQTRIMQIVKHNNDGQKIFECLKDNEKLLRQFIDLIIM